MKATVLLGAVLGLLALIASPASANVSHVFDATFGSATSTPPDPYPISEPTDVAVDQETHDVYVTDPGNRRIEKFDSAGNFLLMFGKEVDKTSKGNVCPENVGDLCQPGASGESPGAFETPMFLAIDNYKFGNGDVYVGDQGSNLVTKFTPAGKVVSSWGESGQKTGTDDPNLPGFGQLFGLAVGGGCATPAAPITGTCFPNGTLFVAGSQYGRNVREYTQAGEWIVDTFGGGGWFKVNSAGNLYFANVPFQKSFSVVEKVILRAGTNGEGEHYEVTTDGPTQGFALDETGEEVYQAVGPLSGEEVETHGDRIDHYSGDCEPTKGPCEPIDSFGEGHLTDGKEVCIVGYQSYFNCTAFIKGVAADERDHTVYAVNSEPGKGNIAVFTDARPIVTTKGPTDVTTSSVTFNGHVNPAGRGDIDECQFEYGYDKTYGHSVPCSPDASASNYSGETDVSATVSGLSPGTSQHYRVVATNTVGASSFGADETFVTTAPAAIDGLTAEELTASSATLIAKVNPNGLPTKYTFEYGPSANYGSFISGAIPASNSDQRVEVELTDLTPHDVYHFRLVTDNKVENLEEGGTTVSEDQTFNFYPPACPNENVRQQVTANYLPECRAYELVSPEDANGTQLYPGGPNTGYATSPSRFAYTGLWSTIPNSGGSPIDSSGDLYVATRTDSGWVTRYVGPPASEVSVAGGPPRGLYGQGGPLFLGNRVAIPGFGGFASDIIQNNDFTNPEMSAFLDWNQGSTEANFHNPTPTPSEAPYVWSYDGRFIDRWPTDLPTVQPGVNPDAEGGVSPGGMHSLDCVAINGTSNNCPGEVNASADLSHFVFSTEWNVFAEGGRLNPPGSVYDNNTKSSTVTVVSRTPSGEDIPNEPTDHSGNPLYIPGVSADGSHILMGASGVGPCGLSNCPVPPCSNNSNSTCPAQPAHLYMRVDDAVTFDVSQGHDVSYVGMTEDASKVYFTSPEQLTTDDHDASVDLYMWSEAGAEEGEPLTLVSMGDNPGNPGEAGNSDSCSAHFTNAEYGITKNCDVVTYSNLSYCELYGGQGGNCRSDNSIAAKNGDIYFLSPEQLDGSRGIPNQENLYDYREGKVQFVASFSGHDHCYEHTVPGNSYTESCSATPLARLQVAPDDSHMAFATDNRVTQYDSGGHLEMYLYDPANRRVACVSCIPNGEKPTSDIAASEDGLFMTNDGRVFFSTEDALVHADTNEALDIYEYLNGRAQLITTGTGDTHVPPNSLTSVLSRPGLVSVSADGRDVYFSTYDTLVSQDHNGLFLKFYDARAGGGFPANAPPPPCEAADECHAAGSLPPPPIQNETSASLAGGNASQKASQHKRHKRHRRHRSHHSQPVNHRQKGGLR
jgi:hypothetical protein